MARAVSRVADTVFFCVISGSPSADITIPSISPGDSARVRLCRIGDAGPGAPPAIEVLREIRAGGNPLAGDLSPDGRWFAVVDAAGSLLSLIDAQSGDLLRQVPLFAAGPRRFAIEAVFAWHER